MVDEVVVDTVWTFTNIASGFSITSVFFAGFLTWFVYKLEKGRRKRDEIYYETQTKSYVHDILTHFVEIDRISTIIDSEESEEGIEIKDEPANEIILHLNRYYKQNYKKMIMLLDNVKISLGTWSSLDPKKRGMYADIIEDFRWLVNDYFSITKEESIQFRMWDTQHNSVSEKRYDIDNKIELVMK